MVGCTPRVNGYSPGRPSRSSSPGFTSAATYTGSSRDAARRLEPRAPLRRLLHGLAVRPLEPALLVRHVVDSRSGESRRRACRATRPRRASRCPRRPAPPARGARPPCRPSGLLQLVLHLHRLDDDERLARLHLVAGLHEHLHDLARHRRGDGLLPLDRELRRAARRSRSFRSSRSSSGTTAWRSRTFTCVSRQSSIARVARRVHDERERAVVVPEGVHDVRPSRAASPRRCPARARRTSTGSSRVPPSSRAT